MYTPLLISLFLSISFPLSVNGSDEEMGGSSVSGVAVTCYSELEECLATCEQSCYVVDHCNDSPSEMVACAPNTIQQSHSSTLDDIATTTSGYPIVGGAMDLLNFIYDRLPTEIRISLWMILLTLGFVGLPGMIVLTLVFVVLLLGCCCTICFCSPCCLCAILVKKRRERNQRNIATQSGVALLPKA